MLGLEGQPGRTWGRGDSVWWGGKDSNLGSRWQQIYSLPPLSTRVPPHKNAVFLPGECSRSRNTDYSLMTPAINKRQKSRLLQNEPSLSPFAHGVALAYW